MKTLKKLLRKVLCPFYATCDVYVYYPYYYMDNNGNPTFTRTKKIKVLKSFKIESHDQATADNDAYDYLEYKYKDLKKYILFK